MNEAKSRKEHGIYFYSASRKHRIIIKREGKKRKKGNKKAN